ncbi:hypothetical protein SAMN02910406_02750 [Ruminococcus albus]|uniref:Uncharacterized protein n=1 Tax=Ruminococcus albus TaxID=1264 RepID=A0A1I1NEY2_RUMAL|nr:hypothetical protein SAMN02910406_02750 [Ruminococcus albus]
MQAVSLMNFCTKNPSVCCFRQRDFYIGENFFKFYLKRFMTSKVNSFGPSNVAANEAV